MAEEYTKETNFFLFVLIISVYFIIGRGSAERKKASYDVVSAVETAVSRIERGVGFSNFTLDLRIRQIAGIEGFFLPSGDIEALWDLASSVPSGGHILHVGARAGAVTAVLAGAAAPSVRITAVECLTCMLGRLPVDAARLNATLATLSRWRAHPVRLVEADVELSPIRQVDFDNPTTFGGGVSDAGGGDGKWASHSNTSLPFSYSTSSARPPEGMGGRVGASAADLPRPDLLVIDAAAFASRPYKVGRTYFPLLGMPHPYLQCLPTAVVVHTPSSTLASAARYIASKGGDSVRRRERRTGGEALGVDEGIAGWKGGEDDASTTGMYTNTSSACHGVAIPRGGGYEVEGVGNVPPVSLPGKGRGGTAAAILSVAATKGGAVVSRAPLLVSVGSVAALQGRRVACCKPGTTLWHLVPMMMPAGCRVS